MIAPKSPPKHISTKQKPKETKPKPYIADKETPNTTANEKEGSQPDYTGNIKLKKPLKIGGSEQLNKSSENKQVESSNDNINATIADQNKPINKDEFYKCWDNMAENIKDESHSLFIAFTKNKPKLNEENQIEVYVDNLVQESEINQKKTKILSLLRNKLNNSSLNLSVKVSPADSKHQKAYLPEEKFQLLSEKNPDLLILKERLNLDFY